MGRGRELAPSSGGRSHLLPPNGGTSRGAWAHRGGWDAAPRPVARSQSG